MKSKDLDLRTGGDAIKVQIIRNMSQRPRMNDSYAKKASVKFEMLKIGKIPRVKNCEPVEWGYVNEQDAEA